MYFILKPGDFHQAYKAENENPLSRQMGSDRVLRGVSQWFTAKFRGGHAYHSPYSIRVIGFNYDPPISVVDTKLMLLCSFRWRVSGTE
ncbi:hypothetical protein J6590_004806, partial [Homalodisca vitripennis]